MNESKAGKYYDGTLEKADFPLWDHYIHQQIARGEMPSKKNTLASSGKSRTNSNKRASRK